MVKLGNKAAAAGRKTAMKKLVNLTPHAIKLNDGTEVPPSGTVARIASSYSEFNSDRVAEVVFGEPVGLPEPEEGTLFIVSGLLASALKGVRSDLVSPATGHPAAVRDESGRIQSVPGFVRA